MRETREDLRTELEAMLAAGRELSPDTDRYLAERFLDRLDAKRTRTKRRRPSTRKPRSPGRTAAALLVAGLALAIGTPISLHANQNNAPAPGYAIAARPLYCSWHTQLGHFHSMRDLAVVQKHASPKLYKFSQPTVGSDGEITITVKLWVCQ